MSRCAADEKKCGAGSSVLRTACLNRRQVTTLLKKLPIAAKRRAELAQ